MRQEVARAFIRMALADLQLPSWIAIVHADSNNDNDRCSAIRLAIDWCTSSNSQKGRLAGTRFIKWMMMFQFFNLTIPEHLLIFSQVGSLAQSG